MGKRGTLGQRFVSCWRRGLRSPASAAPAPSMKVEQLEGRQLLTAAVGPVVDAVWHGRDVRVVQNQYVVEFKAGADARAIAARQGFTDLTSLGGDFYSFRSNRPIPQIDRWARNAYTRVAAVAPDMVADYTALSVPNDPYVGLQWHHNNHGQLAPDPGWDPIGYNGVVFGSQTGTPGADIDSFRAWDITRGSDDVIVAVLDSGIDKTHPDLRDNLFVNSGEIADNGIDDDGNGYLDDVTGWDTHNNDNDVTDDNGHGTHVAGIIGARGNNAVGVTGVAQQVKVLPVKVGSEFLTTSGIITGIQYVTAMRNAGHNIIAVNGSYGGTGFPFNRVYNDAVTRLGEAGVLFVVAAGNDTEDIDPGQTFPAKFSLNQPNVITVAATDNRDQIAFFSNIGATSVQIAAPGVNIFSTLPTYPVGTLLETGEIVPSHPLDYGYASGTSMAAPVVTGVLALMKAAKPDASAAELKAALLAGADYIKDLDRPLPASSPLVSTAGRVNVYRAIQNLLNQHVNVDQSTRGNWAGAYGSDGFVIYGEDRTFPSFVNATVTGGVVQLVADSTTDPDALLKSLNPGDRIAAQLSSAGAITIDLEFTDGRAHRVSLYQANLDPRGHSSQTITVIDPTSGEPLGGTFTRDLATGEYDTFEFNPPSTLAAGQPYRVRLQITPNVGTNAVLNGIFFDPATTNDAALVGVTSGIGGNWRQQFGSEGAHAFGGNDQLSQPESLTGATIVTRRQLARNAAALENPGAVNRRVPSYAATADSMDYRIDLSADAQTHRLTVYAADLERLGRAQRLDLYDDTTGALLSSVTLADFQAGKYVTWLVSGKVRVHVTRLAGPTAVLGGVFLDAAPGARVSYVGTDVTTSGNWRTFYGGDAAVVVGSAAAPVSSNVYQTQLNFGRSDPEVNAGTPSVKVTVTGGSNERPVTTTSRDARYPLSNVAGSSLRYSNAKQTTGSMTVDLDFSDQRTHRVAVYMVDPGKKPTRAQRVDIVAVDPTTGQETVLGSQLVTNFSKGKYVIFDTRGTDPSAPVDVRVRITRVTGRTAVFNGIFFG